MSRKLWKSAVAGAAAMMLAGGLWGAGVASAADPEHPTANTITSGDFKITKRVVGDGTVVPGGEVTFRTQVTTTGEPGSVLWIADRYPEGFEYVDGSARVNASSILGQKWDDVEPVVDAVENTVTVSDERWEISSEGNAVTFEVTYRAPEDAQPGEVFETGAEVKVLLPEEADISGTWVEVREENAGEAIRSGSSDLGFDGDSGSSVLDNPGEFVGNVILTVITGGVLPSLPADALSSSLPADALTSLPTDALSSSLPADASSSSLPDDASSSSLPDGALTSLPSGS
ncbi:hypothetical protein [Rhodococcus sp. NPDC049939]|uniref:hypothetical protein n=1 Tax=Rhodococcus sp. NPDC049939 TaxID=3155511 RepID=UPI0033E06BAE